MRIADLEQRVAGGYDRLALAHALEDDSGNGRGNRYDPTVGVPSRGWREPHLRTGHVRLCGFRGEDRGIHLLFRRLHVSVACIELLPCRQPFAGQRLRACLLALRLCEGGSRTLLLGLRPAHRGTRAFECGFRFRAAPRIEQCRRLRLQSRDNLSRLHGVARLEFDAQHTTCDRRGHHESVAHARLAFLVDRHAQRSTPEHGGVHGNGLRPQCNGQKSGNDDDAQPQAAIEQNPQHGLLPPLQHGDQIELIQPASNDESRQASRSNDDEKRPGDG